MRCTCLAPAGLKTKQKRDAYTCSGLECWCTLTLFRYIYRRSSDIYSRYIYISAPLSTCVIIATPTCVLIATTTCVVSVVAMRTRMYSRDAYTCNAYICVLYPQSHGVLHILLHGLLSQHRSPRLCLAHDRRY